MMSAARTVNLCSEVDSGGWDEKKREVAWGIVRVFPHIQ